MNLKQIIKFGIIGTIGFCVDASVLVIGVNLFLFSIESSRLISFLCAVFVTWLLNRTFTFSRNQAFSKRKEYILYLIIQSIGAFLNYGIFMMLIYLNGFFEKYLIVSLGISALVAMFFNFFMLRRFVFKTCEY
ncbi:GtrA family protein [Arcobacter arenosus]|uniref:GtrA family protein n=1 Tax=Arcobacter arenosus TaxID=2576037 RepID=A0A5R8Y423_9BACT|nr:GtrA family protein [Arcobacter arenosus]